MPKTKFEVEKNLKIKGSGTVTDTLRFFGDLGLGNCITKSIALFQRIDKVYIKAISNDGKIIGKERTDILKEIDKFLDGLILVWRSLEGRKESIIHIGNKKANFYLNIKEKNNSWIAEGQLTPTMVQPVKNFREIYNNKLSPEIINLLKRYGEAAQDGFIDEAEKADLKKGLKQVIYYTIFLRMQIKNCLISN